MSQLTSYNSHVKPRYRPAARAIIEFLPDSLAQQGAAEMAKVELRHDRRGAPAVMGLFAFCRVATITGPEKNLAPAIPPLNGGTLLCRLNGSSRAKSEFEKGR